MFIGNLCDVHVCICMCGLNDMPSPYTQGMKKELRDRLVEFMKVKFSVMEENVEAKSKTSLELAAAAGAPEKENFKTSLERAAPEKENFKTSLERAAGGG